MTEHQIQNEILRYLATVDGRFWRQNTGAVRYRDRMVKFGVPGAADITGILPCGRRVEIEVKTDSGVQSDQQKSYQAMIEKYGGLYILARSVNDVEKHI